MWLEDNFPQLRSLFDRACMHMSLSTDSKTFNEFCSFLFSHRARGFRRPLL